MNLLKDAHYPLKITDHQFDAALDGLCISLDLLELQNAIKNDIMSKVEALRKFIVNPETAIISKNLFQDLGEETGIRKIVEKVLYLSSER